MTTARTRCNQYIRGISSSGRAVALQAIGGQFESDMLHNF